MALKASARASRRLWSRDEGLGRLSVVLKAKVAEIFRKRELFVILTATAMGNPWSPVGKRENLFGEAQEAEEGNRLSEGG